MINDKLKEHFSIVKESSLFKEYYDDVQSMSDVFPMEKHTLRTILSSKFKLEDESKGVYLVRSGGSSAKPLIFPVDIEENLYQRKLLAKELVKFGMFSSKTIALNLFSYKDMYRTAAIVDDVLEKCNATTISLGASSSFKLVYNSALQFNGNIVMGTPSKLVLFAKYVLDNNLQLVIKNIMYAGEFLLASQVVLLKKAFGAQQIYSLYGSAETGIWGWSNYSKKPMSFHILDDIIVEVENPDNNGNGTVVVTNLLRKRFPVFRYKMGDVGTIKEEGNKRILTLISRESKSFSVDAEAYFINDFDWLFNEVDRFQIQLFFNSEAQVDVKFLLIKTNTKDSELNEIYHLVEEKLQQIFQVNPEKINITVAFVSESDLYINNTTSKTPIVIDFRE
ncbi:phenylacetate-CoA ligase [Tenacibaculum sp. MAR_2010_89]|uniref:hypothetical protein n=1 Tax=Tenacibaculum sp. MAR_2010_89 TaxID=1250198 RepID=UPI00089724F5|nr:hypothetical protein [Tenacibaculum sp. MAR_2010_89]SEE58778.1 phenylacetate-CoA ligase [Tenacibaculum sp. MAR_2010_89]